MQIFAFFFGMNNIYLDSLTSGLLLSMNLHSWLSLLGQLPGHWEYNVTRFFCVSSFLSFFYVRTKLFVVVVADGINCATLLLPGARLFFLS
jgi:hypothetical protein